MTIDCKTILKMIKEQATTFPLHLARIIYHNNEIDERFILGLDYNLNLFNILYFH